MLRYGIDDLRLFFDGDLRFLRSSLTTDVLAERPPRRARVIGSWTIQVSRTLAARFCNPDWSSEELADRLTMAGLEVEEIVPVAPPFARRGGRRRCARWRRHPNADKLTRVRGRRRHRAPLPIVCGAPNVAAGMRVPCALRRCGAAGRLRDQGREDARRRRARACCARRASWGCPRIIAACWRCRRMRPSARDVREVLQLDERRSPLKLTPNRARLPVASRRRARSGRDDRRAARRARLRAGAGDASTSALPVQRQPAPSCAAAFPAA